MVQHNFTRNIVVLGLATIVVVAGIMIYDYSLIAGTKTQSSTKGFCTNTIVYQNVYQTIPVQSNVMNITSIIPTGPIMMNYSSTLGGISDVQLSPNGTVIDVAPSTEYVVPFTVQAGQVLKTINLFCQITEGNYATLNCYIIPQKNFPTQVQTNWGNNLFRALVIQNNASIPMQFTTFLENASYYLCMESAGPAHFNFPLSNLNTTYPKYQYLNGSLVNTGRTLAIEYIYQAITFHPGTAQIFNATAYNIRFSQNIKLIDPSVVLGQPIPFSVVASQNFTVSYLNIKINNDYSGSALGSFTFGSETINNFNLVNYQFAPNTNNNITIESVILYTFPIFKPYMIMTMMFNDVPVTLSAYWDYDLYTAAVQTTFTFKIPVLTTLFTGDAITSHIANFTDESITFLLIPETVWETCAANGWYDQIFNNRTSIEVYDFGQLMNHQYPNSYQISFPQGTAVLIYECDTFINWNDTFGNNYNGDQGGYAAPVFYDNNGQNSNSFLNPTVVNNLVFGNQTAYTCILNGLHYNAAFANNNGGTGDIDSETFNFNGQIVTDTNPDGTGPIIGPD